MILHLYLIPDSKEEEWCVMQDGSITAMGNGYNLGKKIAENYRDHYQPKSFFITDDNTVTNISELKTLMGIEASDDYPLKVSP